MFSSCQKEYQTVYRTEGLPTFKCELFDEDPTFLSRIKTLEKAAARYEIAVPPKYYVPAFLDGDAIRYYVEQPAEIKEDCSRLRLELIQLLPHLTDDEIELETQRFYCELEKLAGSCDDGISCAPGLVAVHIGERTTFCGQRHTTARGLGVLFHEAEDMLLPPAAATKNQTTADNTAVENTEVENTAVENAAAGNTTAESEEYDGGECDGGECGGQRDFGRQDFGGGEGLDDDRRHRESSGDLRDFGRRESAVVAQLTRDISADGIQAAVKAVVNVSEIVMAAVGGTLSNEAVTSASVEAASEANETTAAAMAFDSTVVYTAEEVKGAVRTTM